MGVEPKFLLPVLQLTDALEAEKLAEVPLELLATVYHAAPVKHSIQARMEGRTEPAMEGVRRGVTHWTVESTSQLYDQGAGGSKPEGRIKTTLCADYITRSAPNTLLNSLAAVDAGSASGIRLVKVQRGSMPLVRSLEALVQAQLQALQRSRSGDALAEQLLGLLFEPAALESSGWGLQWAWHLYTSHLQPFLHRAGSQSSSAFRQCWSSLPWRLASFHATSPSALAELRLYLLSGDMAVAELLHSMDWSPVLRKVCA